MPEEKIINFPYDRVASTKRLDSKEYSSNVVDTCSKDTYPPSFCISKFYSVNNKFDVSVEKMRDLVLRAMRNQEMRTFDTRLAYALIRNRFDPEEMSKSNIKILGYLIDGKRCDIYYNRISGDIEIRVSRGIGSAEEDRSADIGTKISRSIDRVVRSEISRIEFLELLRSRSQD